MATTLNFKDYIDLPEWKTLANAPATSAAGSSIAFDMRSDISRHPFNYFLRSSSYLDMYNPLMDDWMVLSNPSLAGTFGAGACAVFVPSHGPRGTIGTGATTTSVLLSSGLPSSVAPNQLANRGDGVGFKIRIIDNASGASGKVEERFITYNSGGSTNITVGLDSALSFTPASGSAFEILSGRVYLLSAGTLASGIFKYYDVATNSYSGNLATTNLPSSITTDTDMVALDEQYNPYDKSPGLGFLGVLTATATAAGSITGQASGGDASVLLNEYRNFQIRIVEDTTTPTAVGQRRWISSHTAGASPVYTITPNWTVTPSSNAKYVIEYNNLLLAFTSANGNVYDYCAYDIGGRTANTWANNTFGARGYNMGAGCMSWAAFGIVPDAAKNARHSFVFSFRGGNSGYLDVLDIAGGATGAWSTIVMFGNYSGNVNFTTGTSGCYHPAVQDGRYFYICHNATQRFLRFDCKNRVMEPLSYLRYAQGTAVVGQKMSTSLFVDGSTKVGFVNLYRSSGAEQFQLLISR